MFSAEWAEREMRPILAVLARKWALTVVTLLSEGPRRHRDLRRGIEGISDKVLTAALRSLERDGLIRREVHAAVPARVEYQMTPLGRSLHECLAAVAGWVVEYRDEIEEARARFDRGPSSEDPPE